MAAPNRQPAAPGQPAPRPGAVVSPFPPSQPMVMVVVLLGVMIAAIDATIVILGLPVMITDLHSDLVSMIWVIMAYLLTLTVLGTQVGRLGDMYGRVRSYNTGFAIFTLGSVLCGLAQTGPELIALRVVQGVGGALLFSNSGAIIADNVPASRRGSAFGLTAIGYNLGAILGILLGGILITFVNWRFIFYINLPIGLIALYLSHRYLRERSSRQARRLDLPGVGLMATGLLVLLLGATSIASYGFTEVSALAFGIGVLLLIGFVVWEWHTEDPLLDLSLFRQRVLTASIFAAMFQALGNYAVLFLVIMFLQGVRGLSPFAASLVLIPGYIVGGMTGPISGRVADKIGARIPASFGLVLQMVGILVYSTLGLASALGVVVAGSVLNGVGGGCFAPANNSAVLANAPPNAYGVANGLLRTFANVGMVGSFAVTLVSAASAISREQAFAIFLGTSLLQGPLAQSFVEGIHHALLTALIPLGVALALSLLRGETAVRGPAQ